MQTQVLIISADEVFARMIEIELGMRQISVGSIGEAASATDAEVILIDLDTAMPPDGVRYRRMIGFTRRSGAAEGEAGRLCSLVLRRPFEVGVLCREVGELLQGRSEEPTAALTLTGCTARMPDGRQIALSPREAAVLSLLIERGGAAVTRAEIAERIGESSTNKADVYVCYLRRKLETPERRVIATVRGKGYQLI
ncbi:MAG: winged-helix domain-containing protein [Clostridia bacterium]|nr:winged-helix domain-containing protein [Clostridia bacterium]